MKNNPSNQGFYMVCWEEQQALEEASFLATAIYVKVFKRFMDYYTGLVGQAKKLSYKLIQEYCTENRHPNSPKKGVMPTIKQIRCAIEELKRIGLVCRLKARNQFDSLIFKLSKSLNGLVYSEEVGQGQGQGNSLKNQQDLIEVGQGVGHTSIINNNNISFKVRSHPTSVLDFNDKKETCQEKNKLSDESVLTVHQAPPDIDIVEEPTMTQSSRMPGSSDSLPCSPPKGQSYPTGPAASQAPDDSLSASCQSSNPPFIAKGEAQTPNPEQSPLNQWKAYFRQLGMFDGPFGLPNNWMQNALELVYAEVSVADADMALKLIKDMKNPKLSIPAYYLKTLVNQSKECHKLRVKQEGRNKALEERKAHYERMVEDSNKRAEQEALRRLFDRKKPADAPPPNRSNHENIRCMRDILSSARVTRQNASPARVGQHVS